MQPEPEQNDRQDCHQRERREVIDPPEPARRRFFGLRARRNRRSVRGVSRRFASRHGVAVGAPFLLATRQLAAHRDTELPAHWVHKMIYLSHSPMAFLAPSLFSARPLAPGLFGSCFFWL